MTLAGGARLLGPLTAFDGCVAHHVVHSQGQGTTRDEANKIDLIRLYIMMSLFFDLFLNKQALRSTWELFRIWAIEVSW